MKYLHKLKSAITKPSLNELKQEGDGYYKAKNWQKTISTYQYILKNKYKEIPVELYAKLAIAQRFVKDYNGSEETLKKGLEEFPEHISLLIEHAALENVRENWEEAIKLWERAKSQFPKFSDLNYKRYSKAYCMLYENSFLEKNLPVNISLTDMKFENAVVQNIKERILEIRNELKNKTLALEYAESTNSLFQNNNILLIELAISYMHVHDWNKAIEIFEKIVYDLHMGLDVHNYHRLAKCYEMIERFEKYESLIIGAMQKYPKDSNLQYRYIYAIFLKEYSEKKYPQALKKLNVLLGSGKPDFWHLDKQYLLKYRNKCIKNMDIISVKKLPFDISIIASRADGLGERLNAMLNAIIIAKTFGYKFGYIWKDEVHANHFQKDAEGKKNLVGHAIVAENDFFDTSFIERYSCDKVYTKNIKDITGKQTYVSLHELIEKHKLTGFRSPRLELKEHFHDELLINSTFSYGDAFNFIKFNEPLSRSINFAKTIIQDDYIAIHLRSGDVFYGEYRKFLHYTYKGIVLPLAKAIIAKHLKEGTKVIVFGQDLEILKYLKNTYNIITVDDFEVYKTFDETQKAMFEIVLMSKAKQIVAGSSGFAKLASWISGQDVKLPVNFFSADEQTIIIKDDLTVHGDAYPKLQTSFAYWYAYFYGRKHKKMQDIDFFLTKAYEYDPQNELYPLVLASLQYKEKLDKKAEKTIESLYTLSLDSTFGRTHMEEVLVAKTTGKLNLSEFIPSFYDAMNRGLPFASILVYILSINKDEKEKCLRNIEKSLDIYPILQNFYKSCKDKGIV